jgi:hypothetical protein
MFWLFRILGLSLLLLHVIRAFNAPILETLINPGIDACATDPEGWIKFPVISDAQEDAVSKVKPVTLKMIRDIHGTDPFLPSIPKTIQSWN